MKVSNDNDFTILEYELTVVDLDYSVLGRIKVIKDNWGMLLDVTFEELFKRICKK